MLSANRFFCESISCMLKKEEPRFVPVVRVLAY